MRIEPYRPEMKELVQAITEQNKEAILSNYEEIDKKMIALGILFEMLA